MAYISTSTDPIDDRVVRACTALVRNDTSLTVVDYATDIFNGLPGIVAGDADEMRFAVIRFEDMRGLARREFRPLSPEELYDYKVAVSGYIDKVGIDPEHYSFHLDVIDGLIMGDSDLAVRRIVDAGSEEGLAEPDGEFERNMLDSIAERLERGEKVPHGAVSDVAGNVFFAGDYDD